MTTIVEHMIVVGAKNRPFMLDKTMYSSWKSRILLYIKGNKNGRMMLESIENGPLVYPTIEEDGKIYDKKYVELTEQEKLQDDCDVQATNIVLQDLSQHEGYANEARMMCGRYPDPLALVANYQTQSNSTHTSSSTIIPTSIPDLTQSYTTISSLKCISYPHTLLISQQPQVEFPQLDLGLVVPSFLPGGDPIACLNKAMAFMSTMMASHFPSTNNQLRTSSNPRIQATIQDGRVIVQQVQGRQD
ncbi:hypothetical protein Tco_0145138 [Tanacetum coccineum]